VFSTKLLHKNGTDTHPNRYINLNIEIQDKRGKKTRQHESFKKFKTLSQLTPKRLEWIKF
jgi:hypothetical protein